MLQKLKRITAPRYQWGGKKKKKHFPEKHATQISYTIVHGRKLTHTFVCTKQNKKKKIMWRPRDLAAFTLALSSLLAS